MYVCEIKGLLRGAREGWDVAPGRRYDGVLHEVRRVAKYWTAGRQMFRRVEEEADAFMRKRHDAEGCIAAKR